MYQGWKDSHWLDEGEIGQVKLYELMILGSITVKPLEHTDFPHKNI